MLHNDLSEIPVCFSNVSTKDFFSSLLYEEIDIINPKYIITLGNVPLQAVVKDSKALIGD